MPNVATNPPQDKTISDTAPSHDDARAYLRQEIAELAWAMGVQTEILQRYCLLGQDHMICHSVRQIRSVYRALYEITRRLHELELKRTGVAS